jgi:hypothetical protein
LLAPKPFRLCFSLNPCLRKLFEAVDILIAGACHRPLALAVPHSAKCGGTVTVLQQAAGQGLHCTATFPCYTPTAAKVSL